MGTEPLSLPLGMNGNHSLGFFRAKWVSSTVLNLAKEICKTFSWSTLPILADALQDADCDNEIVLGELRKGSDPGSVNSHVVMLVLSAIVGEKDMTLNFLVEETQRELPYGTGNQGFVRLAGVPEDPQEDDVESAGSVEDD